MDSYMAPLIIIGLCESGYKDFQSGSDVNYKTMSCAVDKNASL